MINNNLTINSVGFQCCNTFIASLGSRRPQLGPVELMCLSIRPSAHLFVCLSFLFFVSLFGDQIAQPVILCSACG